MPTIRYQIRNEYGLADPELHQAADKDDPEAILEGVAMAGLVGALRQLGDLAEFAAEIFRDIHEEVMGMAARGNSLMLRVQQLEAEFPTVEKSLLSHGCSKFSYNDGIDWHSNIQMGQNLITQGDMPRFILDSYEECHGPPRLFTLDKFDTAGAGACLKRYSDPSFFKTELVSSGLVEREVSREKKSRKTKKKGSRWKNGQTLESLLSPLADSIVQPTISDQVLDKSATRFVRLKTRNLNGTSGNDAVNLRKRLLVLHSDEQKGVFNYHGIRSNCNAVPVNLSELSSEIRDTVLDMSANHLLSRDGSSSTVVPIKVKTTITTDQIDNWKEIDETLSDERHKPFSEVGNRKPNFDIVERKEESADSENKPKGSAYDYEPRDPRGATSLQVVDHDFVEDELKFEGSTDGYRTEDIGSELENFVDALNSMESEIEIDSEIKGRIDILIDEAHEMDDNSTEILEKLQTETSELYSAKVSTVPVELKNCLESGTTSIPYSDAESDQAVMQATQENEGVSYSSENSNLILGGTYNENYVELLLHAEVAKSADLISDGVCNMRTFDMRPDIREESRSSNVINFNLNNVCPQENLDTPQLVSSNQNEISAGYTAQLETDEIPRCFDGSSHSDSSCPAKPHRAENGVELISQDIAGTHQMLNDHCHYPTESSNPDTDKACSLIVAVPAVKEMQHSVDQDAKFFASIENREASLGERNSVTSISFVPGTSTFVAQHDGLTAEMDHGQYFEELTEETFVAYATRAEDVPQNKNDPTVRIEDNNVSESPHVGYNPVVLVSEEESLIPQLADYPSDTEDGSRRVKDITDYIEDLEYSSTVNVRNLAESADQDSIANSTETILCPASSITIINGEDCIKKIENTENVENPSYVGSTVGFENDCMENDDLAVPGALLSRLQIFSDTQETQESFRENSAVQSQESPNSNITAESQGSYKVNITDETPESLKVKTSESVSSPCSASETCIDEMIISPVHVLDNLNFATETNQDNHGKNVEEVDPHTEKISSENSSSDGETYNHDRSLFCSQEAYGLQPVVNSTETPLLPIPSVVTISNEGSITKIENMDNAESLFHSADSFGNVDSEKAHLETPKTLQHQLEYFSDTQESQVFCNVSSVEESQKSHGLNSTEGSDESPKLRSADNSQGSPVANTTDESEFLKVQTSEWVSGSEICPDGVKSSAILVLDSMKLPTELSQENPQNDIENMNQIIHVKNLPPETSAPELDPPVVCCPEAYCLQSTLQGESTDVSAASCEGPVWIHETDNPTQALDERSYKKTPVSLGSQRLSLVSDASCSELPTQHSSSTTDIRLHGVVDEEMPIEHVKAYMPSSVNETYPGYPVENKEFASESLLQNNHETAKQEKSLSTYLFCDAASSPQDVSTLYYIKPGSSHQNGEYFELDIPTNSDVTDILSDEPEQNHHAFANTIKQNEVDMLLSEERLSMEAHISSDCISEIFPCHMASNVSDVTFFHLPRPEVAFAERETSLSYESQSDEPISSFASQNPEESPPLPPLPPLEWRTRKLQLDSPFPSENSSQSLAGRNQIAVPLNNNTPANPYMAPPFTLSELPSNTVDQSREHDTSFLDGNIVDLSNESSLVLSSSLEYEKSICASGAWGGSLKLSIVDSFAPSLLENQTCQNSTLQDESAQPIPDKTSHLNQLTAGLELDKSYSSELSHLNSENEIVQPRNPFLVESSLGDVNYHFNYGNFGGENLQLLKSTELSLSSGLKSAQPGYVYSWDGSQTNLLGVVSSTEDEWFSIRPRSIRNLPRNPLIEAVAAHDRSTLRKVSEFGRTCESKADKGDALLESNKLQLRKVSEIVKPSNEPKAFERDALLEQIRNKSFSLKPAHVPKRNNKGHQTNIKVAAILEKANALRQAVAGSDEEDGGDNWSDCSAPTSP